MTDSDGNFIGNANGKFITDSAGTFTITDIAPGTTLIIKETRAKDGYLLDDTSDGQGQIQRDDYAGISQPTARWASNH